MLRPLTAADVALAASSFPARTATCGDGWHPRVFGLLPSGWQQAIAEVLNAVGQVGLVPQAAQTLAIVMLPKPE
eukprot:9113242-Alexandrium_andersonii.AAC.1